MKLLEFYNQERVALREELCNLKGCQITFLTLSVTATGLILGVAATLASTRMLGVVFLFPLVLLLPSWWVFFDKATTITRIVGYYRIIEKLILGSHKASKFLGWENSLGEFRKQQAQKKLQICVPPECKWSDVILLRTTHRYWVISYYTFFTLSGLCILIASIMIYNTIWVLSLLVPFSLFLLSAIWNARVVWELINGRYSYDNNEYFWLQILDVRQRKK